MCLPHTNMKFVAVVIPSGFHCILVARINRHISCDSPERLQKTNTVNSKQVSIFNINTQNNNNKFEKDASEILCMCDKLPRNVID